MVVGRSAFSRSQAPSWRPWVALLAIPGDSIPRRRVAEGLAAAVLFLSLIQITAPMQYGAMALGRPFIDVWLDTADRWLGIDVAQLTAWTAQFPLAGGGAERDLQQPRAAVDRPARRAAARRGSGRSLGVSVAPARVADWRARSAWRSGRPSTSSPIATSIRSSPRRWSSTAWRSSGRSMPGPFTCSPCRTCRG